MDKTPDWLNWAGRQAIQVDVDQYERIAALLGFKGKKETPVENDVKKLKKIGIG